VTLAVALVAGALIGLSLGALGGGGSILAVPVLVYGLGQSPLQATTGSLAVVGVASVLGAVSAYRAGHVLPGRGAAFGLVAVGGAVAGARLAAHAPESLLLAAFSLLMLVVGGVMLARLLRSRGGDDRRGVRPEPILRLHPRPRCRCRKAAEVVGTATVVGLVTGFLGVGGGFLVVPALVLALGLPMDLAAGTSLVVIAISSAAALAVRAGSGAAPDWGVVLLLTTASSLAAVTGARLAGRVDPRRLGAAFTGVVVLVALATAGQALPAVL
jgi:uncharacterized membrane protein YfcA